MLHLMVHLMLHQEDHLTESYKSERSCGPENKLNKLYRVLTGHACATAAAVGSNLHTNNTFIYIHIHIRIVNHQIHSATVNKGR